MSSPAGSIHHIELWVPDLERAARQWGWLLTQLGYREYQQWTDGRSWRCRDMYIVIEQSSALQDGTHDRMRPGLNHLAFHAGDPTTVDAITETAPDHGWTLLFPDEHPHAGGEHTYAAYLVNDDGFEVELQARFHR
ncbi:VOC family protein [Brevibacterium luteolum]|uniref:VOC family protein n=1 Tax=Brevibacterium luteolum TaxID=199591 RepID=UPI001C21C5DE|nr:VOC family protein [Brevibacterium luteolum]MBU8578942.1 VOC family protein [Brevibacterium luteolum]